MKLIVGLGNPGRKYNKTRHNIGFVVIDQLAAESGASLSIEKKWNAEVARARMNGADVLLCKPLTFMNNSGEAVRAIADYYKIAPQDIIVVFDDKDLPLGTVRVREQGSAGGHNGIKSLIQHLGTQEFPRVKIGVANEHTAQMDTAKFVLAKFNRAERKQLDEVVGEALQQLRALVTTQPL